MAKIFHNFSEFADALSGLTEVQKIFNRRNMKELGDTMVERIRIRTRQGKGVDSDNAPQKPLKPLAPFTKRYRKELKKKGQLSNLTTPKKSNQTMTGQMLDSLAHQVRPARMRIFFDDDFARMKAYWNQLLGRKIMFISKKEHRIIKNFASEKIDNYIDHRL